MKHVKLFEDFLFEGDPVVVTSGQEVIEVTKQVADYIKKSPKAKKSFDYTVTLFKAMTGSGTDEAAIFSVFSKIKTKGEMVQIMAFWDMFDFNYNYSGQNMIVGALKIFAKILTGNFGEYEKKVSGRLDKMGSWAKNTLNNLDFWNKADTRSTDAYYKARSAWYKKYPNQRETSLFYWLREDLNEEELAKLNGMIKKFGMKISS